MIQAVIAKGVQPWDFCIIGGGASGLGVAVDAASRGFSTLLMEEYDFAKGTSSRATKLVHGGVRYLQQGNIKLVMNEGSFAAMRRIWSKTSPLSSPIISGGRAPTMV